MTEKCTQDRVKSDVYQTLVFGTPLIPRGFQSLYQRTLSIFAILCIGSTYLPELQ